MRIAEALELEFVRFATIILQHIRGGEDRAAAASSGMALYQSITLLGRYGREALPKSSRTDEIAYLLTLFSAPNLGVIRYAAVTSPN